MKAWEIFEIDCTNYLNNHFGEYASFERRGGSDSTVPDIYVTTESGRNFYIDAKRSSAQCGQFVLLPNEETRTFDYSTGNEMPIDEYAQSIIDHMNNDFDTFSAAGTKGEDIIMANSSDIFLNRVINHYRHKGAEFFITKGFTILPIENFGDYFNITAKFRIKRSGSSDVGKKSFGILTEYIRTIDYVITNVSYRDAKLFVTSPQQLHDRRFSFNDREYMFSKKDGNEYELRKLSNTFNHNVIFSIKLKSSVSGISDDEFINALR